MNYMEMKRLLPSRTGEMETNNNAIVRLKKGAWGTIRLMAGIFGLCLSLGIAALIYYLLGYVFQHMDPTVGWLNIGTLSLSLFAAWSCLLGVGIAELLSVITGIIGKKGGMEKWKADRSCLWQVMVYIGYIVLLCALL